MKTILNFFGSHFKHVDKILPILCVGITIFDIFLVKSMETTGFIDPSDPSMAHIVRTQIIAAVLGISAALVISFIDYKFISKLWFIYAPIALILQLLLFVPSLRVQVDDDMAWLRIGGITIQPSEILKFVFILTLATHISKVGDKINSLRHLLPICAHGLFPTLLIMKQGDYGSALVFLFVFICMLFMAGISWKYIIPALAAVPVVFLLVWNFVLQDLHKTRILMLFDKDLQEQERLRYYLQQYNGMVALGSGQLTGLGFHSDNYTYTPLIYNDFVFSYIGMTLGFIGCIAVVIVLAFICLKILADASNAPDPLGKLICVGVFATIFFHCVINIGMVLSVVPVIGIPLPFLSTGGTAMIMMHVNIGLVLSTTCHREKPKHMFYTEKD